MHTIVALVAAFLCGELNGMWLIARFRQRPEAPQQSPTSRDARPVLRRVK